MKEAIDFPKLFNVPKERNRYSCYHKTSNNTFICFILLYIYQIIGDHQCGFRRNMSAIDHMFRNRQILEEKWEYNEEVHQLFIDFKKAYDSVRREVLYKILIEFFIPRKLVRLKKMSHWNI